MGWGNSWVGLRVFLVVATLMPAVPSSASVLLTFERLLNNEIPKVGDSVGDEYAPLGVSFGSAEPTDTAGPTFLRAAGIGVPESFWVSDGHHEGMLGFHILATFDVPVTYVQFFVRTASPEEFTVKATSFDENSDAISSVESVPVFGTVKGQYALSAGRLRPIKTVVWETNMPFLAGPQIDKLYFEVVPEPAASLSSGFALGLILLLARIQRSRVNQRDSHLHQ